MEKHRVQEDEKKQMKQGGNSNRNSADQPMKSGRHSEQLEEGQEEDFQKNI